ncbi:MAG: 4Fe-4S binding protein [Paludibacteraceae bacterium]|nr:4Fe-4S binding protein [Candidatus Physcocola equi]MCQ2234830.1 4Fe-4S binding protein [Paludibacteraceae bacterium]
MITYFKNVFSGLVNLCKGMYITMLQFCRPKVTEPYPENRKTRKQFERFRGELTMPHNDKNEHKCTGCGICAMNCPNQTITVTKNKVTTEDGKAKIELDQYLYDLGSCIFCGICTQVCPQNAIAWSTNFEHAVFTKSKLVKQLNKPGSKKEEKPAPVKAEPAEKKEAPKENNDKSE